MAKGPRVIPEVFADTGYWIALFNANDELHRRARSTTQRMESSRIVTTEMVLVEFLNYAGGSGTEARRLAAERVKDISEDSHVEIVAQTSAQFWNAVNLYAARLDQRWSLADCASFLLMEERGIQEALAFDHHFEQAGFVALLRENP